MIGQERILVTLVTLLDRVPVVPPPKRGPGRPNVYADRLFLKALVIMIVRHLHTVHELLTVLAQPTAEMQQLRQLLTVNGHFPSRRTWDRRLHALPATLPAQIACLGRALVSVIQPWAHAGRAVALDSTVLRARGGVWHQKDRATNTVPHTSIDTEAHWTKSGWHGWVYGWKLHVAATVAAVWIPLAAELTAANTVDSEIAPALMCALPAEVRVVLGHQHYNTPALHALCAEDERLRVTSRYGRYPHTDAGVEVCRIFRKLRSVTIENFSEPFKGIFDGHGQVPTKGLTNTRRFAQGAVLVCNVGSRTRTYAGAITLRWQRLPGVICA